MTDMGDVPLGTAEPRRRETAVKAGYYSMVAAIALNVPVFVGAVLMAGLALTFDDGPWWSWVRAVPFALMILVVPAALLVAFLWLAHRLAAGKPSLWLSSGLAVLGTSIWFGVR